MDQNKEKEEAEKIIKDAEKIRQEIIRKAEAEAEAIRQAAKDEVKGKIKTQSSDDFRTPEDRIRRTGSDDQDSLVQIATASLASPALSSAGSSSSKKQASLHAYIKSPATARKHVIQHPLFSKRVQESKDMRVLRQLQDKYDEHIINQSKDHQETKDEQQDAGTTITRRQLSWQEFGKMGGRPPLQIKKDLRGLGGGKRSNRKGPLEESRKQEFSAYQKMIIAETINEKINQGVLQDQGEKRFWPSEAKKLKINSERLKDIMSRQDGWKHLVQKHQLCTRGKRITKSSKKYQRASGGGRKREFEPQIKQLKDWLYRERSAGHSISKEDAIKEMESLIHIRAVQCMMNAQQPDQHPESMKAWENEAKIASERIRKLDESKDYRKKYARTLISWIGAKAYQKEQSAEITPQEEKIRAQLTWQGVDHKLWLMGASSQEQLESAGIVSDPASVIKNRSLLSIGMSDQVPLWAKSMPSRMIFSEHELAGHSYQDRKKIIGIREEIEAAAKVIKDRYEKDGEHPSQIIGETLPEHQKKLLSGSKTSRTESAVEKWRITYEARQRISNITGDGPPVGSVEKGLLIFPGSHASLDQLDHDGKYIKDVSFQVGEKITEHKKGSKCRGLQWAVKMRNDHPELMSRIDIMQQPSSNCDAIILSWIIQQQINREPASLFIRDCFSAAFAHEVKSVQFLGNQASTEILGKLTQRIQVTDTDYARSFKSRFRNQLDQFRRDHRNTRSGKLYQVGYYDIIRGVVAAEDELRNQNHQNSWVLAATIRNGILAYLPDSSKGILVPIADQEWASQFKAGSKRIPSDWLEHRLSWVKDGVPIKPDFNLSGRIKAAEDLIQWSYHGDQGDEDFEKLEDQEKDQEKGKIEDEDQKTSDSIIDIPDDIDEEMLIPASNSLFLQISPHLRKQHQWNKRKASYQEIVESAKIKIQKSEDRAQKRDQLRTFARKMLKDKLKSMSRSEAICEIMPIAKRKASAKGTGKGKVKKLSSMLKKSMQKKEKPSTIKKNQKKNKEKTAANKIIPALANEKKKEDQKKLQDEKDKKKEGQKDDESWKQDLIKSEDATPGIISALADLPKNVRVISEAAGKINYGKEGKCTSISKDLVCTIITLSGTAFASADHVMPVSPSWKPIHWKQFKQLARLDKQEILESAGYIIKPFLDYDKEMESTPPAADIELSDTNIMLSWGLIKWNYQVKTQDVSVIGPEFSMKIFLKDHMAMGASDDIQEGEWRKELIKISKVSSTTLIPINANLHWTLLVVFNGNQVSYIDTLKNESKECKRRAEVLAKIILGDEITLVRRNQVYQDGNQCGYYVISYMEQSAARKDHGPASTGWPEENQKQWKMRYEKLHKQILSEHDKLQKEKQEQEKKSQQIKEQEEKKIKRAEETINKIKDHESKAYIAAQEALTSGSQYFKKEMLSENAQIRILKASAGIGICSKCRWQSGCLECSGQHAFKYHMGKEALSKNKIPSYTGHGVGGGVTYHHHHHHHHHPPSCIIITIHIHSFLSLLLLLLLLLLANAKNQ